MKVLVLADAAQDLENARDFYDAICLGVGSYCVDSLLSDIESLHRLHGIHSVRFGCYRMLATRFPFGIYYQEVDDAVRVIAILDLRRNPSWIRQKVTERGEGESV